MLQNMGFFLLHRDCKMIANIVIRDKITKKCRKNDFLFNDYGNNLIFLCNFAAFIVNNV